MITQWNPISISKLISFTANVFYIIQWSRKRYIIMTGKLGGQIYYLCVAINFGSKRLREISCSIAVIGRCRV